MSLRISLLANCLILAGGVLSFASPVSAEPYIDARVLYANSTEPEGNIGGAVALGYDFGPARVEAEVSNHMHLSNGTFGIIGMAYVEHELGAFTPWLGAGLGSSVEDGDLDRPIIQASLGVAYGLTEYLAVTAGYSHRWYFDNVQAIDDDFGDAEDGYATLGIRARF